MDRPRPGVAMPRGAEMLLRSRGRTEVKDKVGGIIQEAQIIDTNDKLMKVRNELAEKIHRDSERTDIMV